MVSDMVDIEAFDVTETSVEGLLVLRMKSVTESRGVVREAFRASAFIEAGVYAGPWKQVNVTETVRGAIRGFHGEQAIKVVAVAAGSAFGAYLDTRPESVTFGQVVTVDLAPGIQVLVPAGVCNAFQATSAPAAQYLYLFSEEWSPEMPGVSVNPLDPELAVAWPVGVQPGDRTQVSDKDAALPTLAQTRERLRTQA